MSNLITAVTVLKAILALLSNPQVQADPKMLSQALLIKDQAIMLVVLAEKQTQADNVGTGTGVDTGVSPVATSSPVEIPAPTIAAGFLCNRETHECENTTSRELEIRNFTISSSGSYRLSIEVYPYGSGRSLHRTGNGNESFQIDWFKVKPGEKVMIFTSGSSTINAMTYFQSGNPTTINP